MPLGGGHILTILLEPAFLTLGPVQFNLSAHEKADFASSSIRPCRRDFLQGSALTAALAALPTEAMPPQGGRPFLAARFCLTQIAGGAREANNERRVSRANRPCPATDGRKIAEIRCAIRGARALRSITSREFAGGPANGYLRAGSRTGDPILICAGFEEGRFASNSISPPKFASGKKTKAQQDSRLEALNDRGVRTGRVGVEEATKFTFTTTNAPRPLGSNSFPAIQSRSPVAASSPLHELELIRLSCEATCDVFRAVFAS